MSAEDFSFDLVAASLRADATDVSAFVEGLAAKLEAALPAATEVKRARSRFRGPRQVVSIDLRVGGTQFRLERHGDHIHTTRALTSGGIVLKTEPLEATDWLEAVLAALNAEAERSAAVRQALERLLL